MNGDSQISQEEIEEEVNEYQKHAYKLQNRRGKTDKQEEQKYRSAFQDFINDCFSNLRFTQEQGEGILTKFFVHSFLQNIQEDEEHLPVRILNIITKQLGIAIRSLNQVAQEKKIGPFNNTFSTGTKKTIVRNKRIKFVKLNDLKLSDQYQRFLELFWKQKYASLKEKQQNNLHQKLAFLQAQNQRLEKKNQQLTKLNQGLTEQNIMLCQQLNNKRIHTSLRTENPIIRITKEGLNSEQIENPVIRQSQIRTSSIKKRRSKTQAYQQFLQTSMSNNEPKNTTNIITIIDKLVQAINQAKPLV